MASESIVEARHPEAPVPPPRRRRLGPLAAGAAVVAALALLADTLLLGGGGPDPDPPPAPPVSPPEAASPPEPADEPAPAPGATAEDAAEPSLPAAPAAPRVERDPRLWPFASESIWNMPIGSGATFADPGFYQPPNGYGTDSNPIVMAPTSPARPVHTHAWPARCHQAGDRASGVSLPVPDDYVVAPGDGNWHGNTPNLAGGVLLADGRTIQELNYFARCTPGGPVSLTRDGLRGRLDLYGDGRPPSFFGAHGGSGLSGVGGSIRRGELISPEPIRHVTKLTVDMTRWGRVARGRNSHRWPAYAADSDTTGQTYGINARGYTPILDMGALLAIPGSVDLASLGLETAPAGKLARAWQDYGAYVVDNAGTNEGFGQNLLNVEHGVRTELARAGVDMETYADTGWQDTPWNRDMNRLFAALRLVTNNGPTSVGGGGDPRVPLAPPLTL